MVKQKNSNKKRDLLQLLLGFIIIVLINYIGSFSFYRFDLTSEKRYSLSEASKEMVQKLDDVLFIKIYLEGEFPAGFKKLRNEFKEMLDEFRAYSNGNIEYEFINPSASPDEKERNQIYKQLYESGLRPTDLSVKEEDGITNKIIWPGAIFTYAGKEVPVNILKSQIGAHPETMINSSIESLEYEIASAIHYLINPELPKVAFIEGHGELDKLETASLYKSLKEYYNVDRVSIDGKLSALTERIKTEDGNYYVTNKFETIIIAKPTKKFTEQDKFIIDQHLMYGGKILWLVDPVFASMDSLQNADFSMAIIQDLNLDDQLFQYGVRINPNLIQDLQAAPIPIVTGMIGNQPKTELFPWYHFPLLMSTGEHPITKNLNAVKGEFVSSVDTIQKPNLKKTYLLQTSKYSKISNAPLRISLNVLRFEPDMNQFQSGPVPVAALIEGTFTSVYKDRLTPKILNAKEIKFKDTSKPTKIIVVGDGDIAKNYVKKSTNEYYTLGLDRFTKQQYGNLDFLLNCVNYLCDDSGLMAIRSKKFKIRLLDQSALKTATFKWQFINTVLPVLLIILFGIYFSIMRRKKFSKK
ncbi:MAG: gliding motility-associated ABC transporter substrate-binding protein GldG [Vicingaceae bacterium]